MVINHFLTGMILQVRGDDWSSFLLPTSAAAEEDIEGFLTYSIYIPENQHVPYKRDEDSKGKDRLPITIFSEAMLVLGGVAHKINPPDVLFQ